MTALPSLRVRTSNRLTSLLDPDECALLPAAAIRWLLARGVSIEALAIPWAVRAARVIFEPNGRYALSMVGNFAYVFGIFGKCGLMDAAAWAPASGQIATRLGISAVLGEGQIGRDEIGLTGARLSVHRTPLEWLQADRCGIVIADYQLAPHLLAGVNLVAADAAHATDLRRILRVPTPNIVVREPRNPA
jgi:hypothetical protein